MIRDLPSDADLAVLSGVSLVGALIDGSNVLRAMFPSARAISSTFTEHGNSVHVQLGDDEDVIAAANRLNARVRKVAYAGMTWIDATVQIGRDDVLVSGPHHKLQEVNPDAPAIDLVIPSWRPSDEASAR